jgi:hypothetical protein
VNPPRDPLGHDPAELLSASKVAALLHGRKQDVLDDLAAGRIPSVSWRGRRYVPRWLLVRWQESLPGVSISALASGSIPGNRTEPATTPDGRR